MKLKKLLAAVTAAALAVTTVAVTSFTASAATETITIGDQYDPGFVAASVVEKYSSFTVTVDPIEAGVGDGKCGHAIAEEGNEPGDGEHPFGTTTCNWWYVKLQEKISEDPWTIGEGIKKQNVTGNTVEFTASEIAACKTDERYNGVTFSKWGCTITSVVGTVDSNYVELKSNEWTKTAAGTYAIQGEAAGNDPDYTAGSSKPAPFKVPFSDILAAGKTVSDVKSVTATVQITGENSSGVLLYGETKPAWNKTNNTVTIEDVDDFSNVEFQVWYLEFGAKVTVTFSVTYKDGTSGDNTPDDPGDDTPPASGNSVTMAATEYDNWYEYVFTKDELFGGNTSATSITFTGADLKKVGYRSISTGDYLGIDQDGTITIQVSDIDLDSFYLHVCGNAATEVTWSLNSGTPSTPDDEHTTHTGGTATCQAKAVCTVCGQEYGELAPHNYVNGVCSVCGAQESGSPSTPSTPSAPSAPTSSNSTSNSPAPVSSITIVDTILATPDGGSSSVTLGSSTKLDKAAVEALAAKGDVTIKFDVAGGAYWEIDGENITDAKDVDLGVKVNGNLIPENKVSEFAGDKTTVQLTLRHNGDFGFTGILSVPVGKANNGKFANLYYYHGGKFDFVGSSAISGGMTKFAFSHASNYLIVIDDYAYGEDVSSAAGMTETAAETTEFPYVAVLVIISAFGTSAIVLKKRLSK